ncbi:hypothetical protein K474DRAFT_1674876 [Panus rudis PR-1116 ss-1]|nr:hypothetical protein K474DRAFT_1674876 [Panus rudis PR-1116 ss-1]
MNARCTFAHSQPSAHITPVWVVETQGPRDPACLTQGNYYRVSSNPDNNHLRLGRGSLTPTARSSSGSPWSCVSAIPGIITSTTSPWIAQRAAMGQPPCSASVHARTPASGCGVFSRTHGIFVSLPGPCIGKFGSVSRLGLSPVSLLSKINRPPVPSKSSRVEDIDYQPEAAERSSYVPEPGEEEEDILSDLRYESSLPDVSHSNVLTVTSELNHFHS